MFRKLSINSFKLFLAGNGVSAQAGREFVLFALVGVLVGLCTAFFNWLITLGHKYLLEGTSFHESLLPTGEIGFSLFEAETFSDPKRFLLLVLHH